MSGEMSVCVCVRAQSHSCTCAHTHLDHSCSCQDSVEFRLQLTSLALLFHAMVWSAWCGEALIRADTVHSVTHPVVRSTAVRAQNVLKFVHWGRWEKGKHSVQQGLVRGLVRTTLDGHVNMAQSDTCQVPPRCSCVSARGMPCVKY